MESHADATRWATDHGARPPHVDETLSYIFERVGQHIPPVRLEQQVKRLWPRRFAPRTLDDTRDVAALALYLLHFTPDPKGRTAFDRLAARETMPDSATCETLDAVRAATFRVLRVEHLHGDSWAEVRDVLSDAQATLAILHARPGDVVAGFLTQTTGGHLWPATVLLRLPHGMADFPYALVDRTGKRFKNTIRAAERVYATAVAHMLAADEQIAETLHVPGQPAWADAAAEPPPTGPLEAGPDAPAVVRELLEVAHRWAERLPADPHADDPATVRRLRQDAGPDIAVVAVDLASRAEPDSAQARALDTLARILVETVEHRAALDLGETTVAALDAMPASSRPGESAVAYLHRLRAELGRRDDHDDSRQTRLIAQIRALRAKTEAAGCTEDEALAAAEKAEELVRRYDISMTPAQVSDQPCTAAHMATGRKRPDGIDACVMAIAALCDCRTWLQTCPNGHRTHVFFGLPADVAAAEAVYRIVQATFATETAAFKESATYRELHPNDRGQATTSFRWGLGDGIREKLEALAAERTRQTKAASGRALVTAKQQAVDDGLDKLGLAFKQERPGKRLVDPDAYHQGVRSGRAFAPAERLPAAS